MLEEPEKYDLAEAKRRHKQQNFVEAYNTKEVGYAIADAEKLLRSQEEKGYISPKRKHVIMMERLEL